ncbi:lipopolysaccharide/colanic/teichoic acid biosynthesis glycosyltransferase [Roseiarcus fermentans]|uniref:Lipopolysaccharide/colanic/teichoic acid biosynthesis glycosyltransferase n=1 Tax=Roseiarcus fermentans TaxID=1473586 RepID=A0A366FK95_9HYPH|nr:sugar transferase [Roseiarcus fermentans]RBP14139.1 lipopolysaccharide/colanic/teichoic acid biosynthesis glycosyltransferase [Roseiarcus fermentans]
MQDLPVLSRCLKRSFDIAGAALGLLLLAPALIAIGVTIRSDSAGPVFFRQVRGGKGGSMFLMFKFRTMVIDADDRLQDVIHLNVHHDSRLYKIPDDPRVTRFGAFLRRYALDELPQLLNVLRGEMSLVGPRPLMLSEERHVQGGARLRASVKPGITGPWQVSGRNDLSFEQMMLLDCRYVTRWSFSGDLLLLARTLPAIVRRQSAY